MKTLKVSTAAFLAGVTTLAVSLPLLAENRTFAENEFEPLSISAAVGTGFVVGDDLVFDPDTGAE